MMIARGAAIGVIISAPMGPVGILCVQRTLNGGRRHGFYTGIGAAISDLFYCLLTGFGLSFIEMFLQRNQQIIQIIGSIVLLGFGIYIMRKNPARALQPPPSTAATKGKDILSGFMFTFSNPFILFLIIGLFARFGFQSPSHQWYHYVIGFVSIFLGATAWWWTITYIVNKVRAHFNVRSMWVVNRVIGIVILIFAIVGVIGAFTNKSHAVMPPSERLRTSQTWHPSPTPTPDTIITDGPEVARFLIARATSGQSISGVAVTLTDMQTSPLRRGIWKDDNGKTHRVRHPQSHILLTLNDGSTDTIALRSRPAQGYTDNPHDVETLIAPASKITSLLKATSASDAIILDGRPDRTLLRLDFSDSDATIECGGKQITVPLPEHVTSVTLEAGPGAALTVDKSHYWTRQLPDTDVRHPDAGDPPPAGIWRLYSFTVSEGGTGADASVEKGGDYTLTILPAPDGGYDIRMLSGATVNASSWPQGRLKGRLLPSPYADDWTLLWFDADGNSCGPDTRAHMSGNTLQLIFPRHDSTLLFIRQPEQQ